MPTDPVAIGLIIGFLILSLGIHEAAHAWVAYRSGDTTARDLGRMTLNPIVHIDLIMTILLPLILVLSGLPPFGGAKPVPVVYNRLRKPLRDMMFVALAGPVSNVLLAFVFGVALHATDTFTDVPRDSLAIQVLARTVELNLVLAIFNMIPVPPLDGSRVMAFFLPTDLRDPYVRLERFGMIIVFLLLYTGVLWQIIAPPLNWSFDFVLRSTGSLF